MGEGWKRQSRNKGQFGHTIGLGANGPAKIGNRPASAPPSPFGDGANTAGKGNSVDNAMAAYRKNLTAQSEPRTAPRAGAGYSVAAPAGYASVPMRRDLQAMMYPSAPRAAAGYGTPPAGQYQSPDVRQALQQMQYESSVLMANGSRR